MYYVHVLVSFNMHLTMYVWLTYLMCDLFNMFKTVTVIWINYAMDSFRVELLVDIH